MAYSPNPTVEQYTHMRCSIPLSSCSPSPTLSPSPYISVGSGVLRPSFIPLGIELRQRTQDTRHIKIHLKCWYIYQTWTFQVQQQLFHPFQTRVSAENHLMDFGNLLYLLLLLPPLYTTIIFVMSSDRGAATPPPPPPPPTPPAPRLPAWF